MIVRMYARVGILSLQHTPVPVKKKVTLVIGQKQQLVAYRPGGNMVTTMFHELSLINRVNGHISQLTNLKLRAILSG